ncbi:MAG: hypothetical protein FJ146_10045 [Deltaproteobacteria bacterium]|nr:hypothetical protein [Deltaproteobacteria bacterium]
MLKTHSIYLPIVLLIASLKFGCTHIQGTSQEPAGDLSQGPAWKDETDAILAAIATSSSADQELVSRVPALAAMAKKDATTPQIFGFWGTSINFDEAAKAEIVNASVLTAVGRLAGVPMAGRHVHAGLAHTYGYLLSNLVTPYGYKRERWTLPTIDQGFGWNRGPIAPVPPQGTLLTNVTLLAGKIAFRDDAKRLHKLTGTLTSAAPEIVALDTSKLVIRRLTETVTIPEDQKAGLRTRTIKLYTDLVKLPQVPSTATALTHILVYSIADTAVEGRRLITLFPMTDAAANGVFTPANLGADKPVVTRYNAYVPGLTGHATNGRRIATP